MRSSPPVMETRVDPSRSDRWTEMPRESRATRVSTAGCENRFPSPHEITASSGCTAFRKAIEDDHAEAIVLGCAGMTDFAASLAAEHGLPVIDGVAVAVALAESLVRVGLKTSRRGGYAPPLPKSAHVVGI